MLLDQKAAALWLVISSYRNDDQVLGILEQVHASQEPMFDRVLVVDSEGTGVVPRSLQERGWERVIYKSYDRNLGSGANLHERLRLAAEGGADYAYALNHDAYFDPNVVSLLLKTAQSTDRVGAVYPLSRLTALGLYNVTGTRELPLPAKFVASPPSAPLLDVYWSSSNGALYATEPVRRGIVPWEAMWMAWEDLEYGWQLSSHGYRQVIVCDAVFHDNFEYIRPWFGRAMDKPPARTYYHMRNLLLAIRRRRNRPLYYLVALYRVAIEGAVILLARPEKWKRLRLLCAGVFDGLNGIEGQVTTLRC